MEGICNVLHAAETQLEWSQWEYNGSSLGVEQSLGTMLKD